MSELLALGISHKTAPVELRERVALTEREGQRLLAELTATPAIQEAVAISTCNRTELYLVVDHPVEGESTALGMLAQRAGIRPTELTEVIYSPRNCDAARQLYRVTAGLESMIVGEAEVQGQVKRAYESARAGATTGPLTNRLFAAALTAGKRVRDETSIGESRVSVSSVAVQLARELLGSLEGRNVVIIGAGETSELTARALADQGVTTIYVANRHADRALAMAQRFGGHVVGLDKLPDQLVDADMLVASTSSPHAIVGQEELELVMLARGGRPLLLIDIAVPRDIDPACADLDGVTLRDIDDLQAIVARNISIRLDEVPRAEQIIEDEIQRFAGWLGQVDALPTIAALRERGNEVVEQVLSENANRWESASARDVARVVAVARAVMNRLLHEPTIRLKSLGAERRHGSVQLLRDLFALGAADEAETLSREPAAPPSRDLPVAAAEPSAERSKPDNVRPLDRRRRRAG
jgi:glutamyl-tRNA reductase